jgi:hypothetical protein
MKTVRHVTGMEQMKMPTKFWFENLNGETTGGVA